MSVTQIDALVVGAGLSGLYQLYKLRDAGLSVVAIESAPDVGGTWYWNAYPGCRVDSPANIYQYWFSQELLDEWNWSERFPAQPEIKAYLTHVAERFDLYANIEFETSVRSATWNEDEGKWYVTTSQGTVYAVTYLVNCVGLLSTPKILSFPDQEKFTGKIYHTAKWPQEPVDLSGKRVGIIGNGATGIQVIQTIAPEVAELTVFQRTPQYAVRMLNYKIDDEKMAEWRADYPRLAKHLHTTFAGFQWDPAEEGYAETLTKEQRRAVLEECWADGSLKMFVGTFPEVLVDPAMNEEVTEFVRDKIRAQIDDPEIAEKLIPQHDGYGLKRVPLENGYYEAFNRPNVHLVDVKAEPIEGFTENGLLVGGREYELDVLIMATGFDAGTGTLARMGVTGREGKSLTELWSKDIRTTLGLQVHGFPNMFLIGGPLSPSAAFCNVQTCIQQQIDWVTDAILNLRDTGKSTMEPTAEREEEWVQHHDEVANATLMVTVNSWYMGANIEGKQRRLLSYIGGAHVYKEFCDDIQASGYPGFSLA
ncbi:MAG: NAD(P)/FAD-dependent oxidoreductase [Cellvibrionales bacterium]|jgi:acetone monooxygenase